MKPTCPNACPLKEAMNQHREDEERNKEIRWTWEQLSPFARRQVLAHANFLYYRHKGLTKFSTWREMAEQQRVLYFVWGCFERIDFVIGKGK